MSKKDGAEFDECFIGYQIAMHAGMKNKLVVFERHVSLHGGTGVGLSLARALVESSGGRLELADPSRARFRMLLATSHA